MLSLGSELMSMALQAPCLLVFNMFFNDLISLVPIVNASVGP